MALRADNYFTDLGGHVFLGGAPVAWCGHLDRLRDLGVTGVINLMDEYTGPLEQYNACGIIQLHLRVVDHDEPTVEDLEAAVNFIQKHVDKRGRVYIHCKAGHGRSAAVAFAWLIHHDPGTALLDVQSHLLSRRKVRKKLYQQKNILAFCIKQRLQQGKLRSSLYSPHSLPEPAVLGIKALGSVQHPVMICPRKRLVLVAVVWGLYFVIGAYCARTTTVHFHSLLHPRTLN